MWYGQKINLTANWTCIYLLLYSISLFLFYLNMNRYHTHACRHSTNKLTASEQISVKMWEIHSVFVSIFCGFSNRLPHCPTSRCYSFQQIDFVEFHAVCCSVWNSVFAWMCCACVSGCACVGKSDFFVIFNIWAIREYNNFSVFVLHGHMNIV